MVFRCFPIAAGECAKRFWGGGASDVGIYTHFASSLAALAAAFFESGGSLVL